MTYRFEDQHQTKQEGNEIKYMVTCNNCGTYVRDSLQEPAVDFLCDDCEFFETW